MRQSTFHVVERADAVGSSRAGPFDVRTELGWRGVVYSVRAPRDGQSYQLEVEGAAFDRSRRTVLYHSTFVIHIAVAAYPY